ncbi:MAG TPA: CPBP family intramembrane glutamic endopeptidase, partial [Bdellovibrio sp.]|nr:CPBP family intramembrane glutamic endopeptidase [Bdellovibrio sp.]
MSHFVYALSLIIYVALSFLYFVERDFVLTFYAWLALLLTAFLLKPMREHALLLLLIGLCFCLLVVLSEISPWLNWPFDFYLVALFGFGLLRFGIRRPAEKLKWSFAFSKLEWLSIFAINIPAIFVLTYYYKFNPEIANAWPLPKVPLWSVPFVVVLIAIVNGLREEIFYRGLLQPASGKMAPAWFVIGLQAVLFGFLHFMNAFPQGWLGVLMTAVWGAAIATQYRFFKS